jgi:hypothetical protein
MNEKKTCVNFLYDEDVESVALSKYITNKYKTPSLSIYNIYTMIVCIYIFIFQNKKKRQFYKQNCVFDASFAFLQFKIY